MLANQRLKIAFLTSQNPHFMTVKVYDTNFYKFLKPYAQVTRLRVDRKNFDWRELEKGMFDFIYVDLVHIGILPFVARAKQNLNIRFLVIGHALGGFMLRLLALQPLLREDDAIIFPSAFSKKRFAKYFSWPYSIVIPNSTEAQYIKNFALNICDKHENKIVYLSRLIKDKGLEPLLQGFEELQKQVSNIKLDIVAPFSGTEDHNSIGSYYDYLQKTYGFLFSKNQDAIVFHGYLSGDAKYKILASAKLLFNLSYSADETFGMNNIEALSCGVPVICSQWSAFPEIIQNGYNGFLIPLSFVDQELVVDSKNLVSTIAHCLLDQKLYKTLVDGASKSALLYDFKKVMPILVGFLQGVRIKKAKNVLWDKIKKEKYTKICKNIDKNIIEALGLNTMSVESLCQFVTNRDPVVKKRRFALELKGVTALNKDIYTNHFSSVSR